MINNVSVEVISLSDRKVVGVRSGGEGFTYALTYVAIIACVESTTSVLGLQMVMP